MNLVIVESPAKAHTIKKFLGPSFQVTASLGHIKDLPQKTLGVDVENNFTPKYEVVPGRKKVVDAIRKAAADAERVYIATDPDREGEAIAAHVAEIIRNSHQSPYRVLFHEITRGAVQHAIASPIAIDQNKVDAQIARRVVDRLVGYQVSPFIWKTVAKGLSAGRVQSVALRLICEREQEIRVFVPEEYWSIHAQFEGNYPDLPQPPLTRGVPEGRGDKSFSFWAELAQDRGSKVKLPNENAANDMVARVKGAKYQVSSVKRSVLRTKPYAPFTTSTLQQDASRRLRLSSKKTMSLAQALYEGVELPDGESVGLITYMRTDSTRIASEALSASRDYIKNTLGDSYLPEKVRVYSSKKSAQDAHEAIRPTDVNRTPQDLKNVLDAPLWKLYNLIWTRFVASQMNDAVFDVTVVEIEGDGLLFRARGQTRTFDGWQRVYPVDQEKGDVLPTFPDDFDKGYPLDLNSLESKQHFTQPSPRYTEATLIKTLDELGIGRPSTYASIISTLYDRTYVKAEERKLAPTALGETVNGILVSLFPDIFDVGFTARMEEQLDQVEEGTPWVSVVSDFYQPFSQSLQAAEGKRKEVKQQVQDKTPTSEICEKCGRPMVIKWSRRGQFLACTGFPECRNTRPLEAPKATGKICPECGGDLVIKEGKYGRFLGCSNYPKCRHIEPLTTGVKCPTGCGGEFVEKGGKKGRFYSCSNYPKCKYHIQQQPEPIPCPECGHPFMVHGKGAEDGQLTCPKCKTVISVPTGEAAAMVAVGD